MDFSNIFLMLKNDVELKPKAEKLNNIGYSILLINDNNFFIKNKINCDYRIYDDRYRDSILTLVVVKKSTNELLLISSIIFYYPEIYNNISFWYYDKDKKMLRERFINDFLKINYEKIITLGYSERMNIEYGKLYITVFYLNFIKKIINMSGYFLFTEIQGTQNLEDDILKKETIRIDDLEKSYPDIVSKIGITNPYSIPAEKSYKHFGLKPVENLYNKKTLGKVYMSI
jgi:hypothetical protein